jgi:hypothetical protein
MIIHNSLRLNCFTFIAIPLLLLRIIVGGRKFISVNIKGNLIKNDLIPHLQYIQNSQNHR